MMNRFETHFDAFYAYFTTEADPILKTLGQFENLGFVIMSTRENIRLIDRAPLISGHMLRDTNRDLGNIAEAHKSLLIVQWS